MKKIKVLSLVSSQFQLRNSIEVSKKFLDGDLSLILFILNENHHKQLKSLVKKKDLHVLAKINMRRFTQYLMLLYKIFLIRINYKIDNLIIGHSRNNLMKICEKILSYKKLIFVDDGEILELINSKSIFNFNNRVLPIDYYTIFNLKSTNSFNFIKYNYEIFNNEKKKQKKDSCLFIGSCYVETNLVSEIEYLEFLRKIIKKENLIEYFCHPREELKKFKGLEGIRIIKPNMGIEHYFEDIDHFPKKVIGIYSTAFFSLKNSFSHLSERFFIIDARKFFNIGSIRNFEHEYALKNFKEYDI